MVNRRGKVETSSLFLGSRNTMDGDCSHEIKRQLLIGRKTVTNLDSMLSSRDSTLWTMVCIVKGMVFPVVMYICESWSFIFGAPKSLQMVTAAMKLKDACSLKGRL